MAVFRSLLVVFAFAAALDITARRGHESALADEVEALHTDTADLTA
jgi:hypothetical protein